MSQVLTPLRNQPRVAFEELIRLAIQASIRAKQALLADAQIAAIDQVARVIVRAYQKGNQLLIFGNGGGAAEAQHFAAELVGKYYRDRPPLPALALTVNTSSLTSIGNDYSFTQVFARQVEALGREGDIALGISTSGHSANVIKALIVPRRKGLTTIGLTGVNGGMLRRVVDYCLCVPAADPPRIQEGHILLGHILSEIVEQELFPAVTSEWMNDETVDEVFMRA